MLFLIKKCNGLLTTCTKILISYKFFTKRSDVHNYPTRHGNHLDIPKNKKIFSDQSARTNGPQIWIFWMIRKGLQSPLHTFEINLKKSYFELRFKAFLWVF